jgi:molybdopterin-guanine dinucleotide biosynthesis protein
MEVGGIFGPKLSGKTTLANAVALEHFTRYGIKTLILDPHTDEWGKWNKSHVGFITADEKQFWKVVWSSKNCLVIVEEAADYIARNRDLIPVFTRLRHLFHKLLVVGHSGMSLLPVMREQVDTIYLFRQPKSASQVWAEVMTEQGLLAAMNLQRHEFIMHTLFGKPRKLKLPPPK